MPKVILYCRKSEKPKTKEERTEERQILSLESQEKHLRELAKVRGLEIVKVFKENESAYKPGRPLFEEMIKMLKKGKADCIAVWQLNRIARNSLDGGQVIFLLDEGFLQSINTPSKRYEDSSEDKFILSIEFAMAKKSSDDSSSNIKRDMLKKAENGEYPCKAFLGYLNIDSSGRISGTQFDSKKQILLERDGRALKRIEIDPIMGTLISNLFEEAARGNANLRHLCDYAKELGIRTRNNKLLGKSSMRVLLRNSFYYGVFLYGGNLYTENVQHEPLVSKNLFDRVQGMLEKKGFVKMERFSYCFAQMMTCGDCGSTISGQTQKGHKYYHCTKWETRFTNRKCTEKKYYREEWLANKIGDYLTGLDIPDDFLEVALASIKVSEEKDRPSLKTQKMALKKNMSVATQKLSNLMDCLISPKNTNDSLISKEAYKRKSIELEKEIKSVETELKNVNGKLSSRVNESREKMLEAQTMKASFLEGSQQKKREIVTNLGEILLNHGKLQFEANTPYSYLKTLHNVYRTNLDSSEPQFDQIKCGNATYSVPKSKQWWTVLHKFRTQIKPPCTLGTFSI